MKWVILTTLAAGPALACTLVSGDHIRGADLAREQALFQAMEASLDLGPAPAVGAKRILRVSELRTLAKRLGISFSEESVREACFERATQRLNPEVLAPVLVDALDTAGAHIEILDFTRNALPLGELEFPRSGLAAGGLWRGSLKYGEHRSVPVWARVRITSANGETIAQWRPPAKPVVMRGETVQVEVRSGQVLLAFDTVAESSGHAGEGVLVRNPANGQKFRAVVETNGKVRVQK